MKHFTLATICLITALVLSGCVASTTDTPAFTASVVEDQASLLCGLEAAGMAAEVGDTVIQDFFTPEGQIIRVNDQDLQVFEYETVDEMESEAAQVAPDGGSVGTSMMMWMDSPHFYKTGRIIVLYIGSDQNTLDLLQKVIGSQFAGQ